MLTKEHERRERFEADAAQVERDLKILYGDPDAPHVDGVIHVAAVRGELRPVKERRRMVLFPGEAVRHAAAGRNDPCPCGSGKKYKRCCGT